jgi:hypothetical protein
VPVALADVVGLGAAVVEGQLQLGAVPRQAEEDHGRRVAADAPAATLLEPERAVEGERPLLVQDADHGVDEL